MLTTLCFQDMIRGLCWKHFLSLSLWQNYRGSLAEFYAGFPKTGYLGDMCYVKLSPNLNLPFAELSRTPKYTCNGSFYVNPLRGPFDPCSYENLIYIYIYTYMICTHIKISSTSTSIPTLSASISKSMFGPTPVELRRLPSPPRPAGAAPTSRASSGGSRPHERDRRRSCLTGLAVLESSKSVSTI